MITREFTKRLWLHKDPEGLENFNEIFRSRTEPFLDEKENAAVLSEEAHFDGDMIMHVCINSKPMFPKELWEWVGRGEKVGLDITIKATKKNLDEPITEPITKAIEENKGNGEEYLYTHDRLIFGLKGDCTIHERQFILHTPFVDDKTKKNVEYINSYGEIIHHPECVCPNDCYVVFGHAGDIITPYLVGQHWGNDRSPKTSLRETLVKAYQHGLRFENAPDTDEIVFNVERVKENIIGITCDDEFYGFGENMTFCTLRDYQENSRIGTRGLDKVIIDAIVAYRWFFNKPHLIAKLKAGKGIEKDFIDALCAFINKKVNDKYDKFKNKRPYFNPQKLRTKTLIMPYAEEKCRKS